MVEEEYAEKYEEKEAYDEPYTEWVSKKESYEMQVPYTDTESRSVQTPYIERGNALGKFVTLGLGFQDKLKHETTSVSFDVTKYREETQTRDVQVPEVKQRTAYRTVAKYRTKTRQVPKTVEYKVPPEHFTERATAEITAEMREALASQGATKTRQEELPFGASAVSDAGRAAFMMC